MSALASPPYILLDDQISGDVRLYDNPVDIIGVWDAAKLSGAFEKLERYRQDGFFCAGYVSYEAGYALEPKLAALLPQNRSLPLLQFGIFKAPKTADINPQGGVSLPTLTPSWSQDDYLSRFKQVKAYLEAGDVYQINLTFPMSGSYDGAAWDIYAHLRQRQAGRFGAVVSLGGSDIVSLSPELFFKKDGDKVTLRPMKGTTRRMADPVQDAAQRDAMRADLKSQAENLMIVDLLRNDISRLARPGSVKVPELFALETYPTLHQMTSRITASVSGHHDIQAFFQSLFPCGSVTGAPKVRAMEIIHELENTPRGAYCGAIGYMDPDGTLCFNVAIRTLTLKDGQATYNVGGGVVLDSIGTDEYEECLLKAKVITGAKPDLIETFRWSPQKGFIRKELHLKRLLSSANALGYPCDIKSVTSCIHDFTSNKEMEQRIRLSLSPGGQVNIEGKEYKDSKAPWRVSLCKAPLTSDVQETRYKVSARTFYDEERQRLQSLTDCDEVLFFNDEGQLCEGSFTSVFIEKGGQLYTPDISCGLLPGILRESLIADGLATPTVLTLDDVLAADRILVGNSLRGLIEITLTSTERL